MSTPAETILVVEDESGMRRILESSLTKAGYTVLLARSAEEARVMLAEYPQVSLMLLDIGLPGMTGLAFAQQLKQVLPHFPFIMLTANDEPPVVQDAISAGALSYLVKPVDVRQLLPAVQTALARYRELDGLRQNGVHLQRALDGDRSVSIAIGMLMYDKHISQEKAFNLIRDQARHARINVTEVAKRIIKELPRPGR